LVRDLTAGMKRSVFDESHGNYVTQLQFHPSSNNMLISGGEDGLVCVFDVNFDKEEDAIQTTYLINDSISRMGLFGNDNRFLYCTTSVSFLSIIDILSENVIVEYTDLRPTLSSQINQEVNYLIDCYYCEEELVLAAGSFNGDVHLFSYSNKNWSHKSSLVQGHSTEVRCLSWDFHRSTIITGAEDSKILFWQPYQSNVSSMKSVRPPNTFIPF